MLDWLRFRYKVWRLKNEKNRVEKSHYREWDKLKGRGEQITGQHVASLRRNLGIHDDKIVFEVSWYLRSRATKLLIPIPLDDWEFQKNIGHYCLTEEGMVKLLSAIRAEKKERSEILRLWLSSIAR